MIIKGLGVDDVRVGARVQEYLDDVEVAKSDRVSQVGSPAAGRFDFLVGVGTRVYEDAHDFDILIPYGQAQRRLIIKIMVADGVQIFGAQASQGPDILGVAIFYREVQGSWI